MKVYLVRGIVGSGKTVVSEEIAKALGAQRLSRDSALAAIRFDDSVKVGDAFRTDDAYKTQQRFVYELLLEIANGLTDVERFVKHAKYIALSQGERERVASYVESAMAGRAGTLVVEATFSNPDYLKLFVLGIKAIAVIEVQASDESIRARIPLRKNESNAALNIYEAMKTTYKACKELGVHAHVIHNDGTLTDLRQSCHDALIELETCPFCRFKK